MAPSADPDLEFLRTSLWEQLAPGFRTLTDLIEWARVDAESDDEVRITADESEDLVVELWRRREAELAARPGRGDDAALEAAFAALEAVGVVAEMNCGVDQEDGASYCRDRAEAEGRSAFVFFSEQDSDRLVHPDPVLYLGFDAVAPRNRLTRRRRWASREAYDEATQAAGRRIVTTLQQSGLDVRWNGSVTARVVVVDVDWRRPLPPD